MAKLVIRHGPMWSDKTSWLIKMYGDGRGVLAFKPSIDTRYTKKAVLHTHNGQEVKAVMISNKNPQAILNLIKKHSSVNRIIIDEINFFDDQLVKVIKQVLKQKIDVFAAGLVLDTELKDFGPTRKLVKMADKVKRGYARCDYRYGNGRCRKKAVYNFAKKKKDEQLVVGAGEMYGATCKDHYHLLHVGEEKTGQWLKRLSRKRLKKIKPEVLKYLETLNPPYIRRSLNFSKNRWPRIEVGADSMRVGKTTAVKVLGIEFLKMGLPVMVSLEDWRHNTYLKKSYKDSSKVILDSQKWFAKRKFDQVKLGAEGAVFIQDVHPEMDFCYALTNAVMGRMSLKHFKKYVKFYFKMDWGFVPASDVLVYLTASNKVLLKRAPQNKREFETIDKDYFLCMKEVNQAWLGGANNLDIVVLSINTDDYDFVTQDEIKKKLAMLVLKKLRTLGWDYL